MTNKMPCSGVASMEQMEQLLPPDSKGPLFQIVQIRWEIIHRTAAEGSGQWGPAFYSI